MSGSKIYVDVSASTPNVKKNIANNLTESNSLFVDAAMLGSLVQYQHKVPMLVSGPGAVTFF